MEAPTSIITGADEARLPDLIFRAYHAGHQLRVCSWCQTPLMSDALKTATVTHSICEPCYQRELAKVPQTTARKR